MNTCPVQTKANADERLAEAQDQSAMELNWQDAEARAAMPICIAIRCLPAAMRTQSVFRDIISTLRVEMQNSSINCKYALDGLLDAFIALDKKS